MTDYENGIEDERRRVTSIIDRECAHILECAYRAIGSWERSDYIVQHALLLDLKKEILKSCDYANVERVR